MRRPYRLTRRRKTAAAFLLVGALGAGALTSITPDASADSIVTSRDLIVFKDNTTTPGIDERQVPVKNPFDPKCTRLPGLYREGKVWVSTYVTSSGGRYNGLKWFFNSRYRKGVTVAKESWRNQYGTKAPCDFLNTFDNKTEVQALQAMTCNNPYSERVAQAEPLVSAGAGAGGPAGTAHGRARHRGVPRTEVELRQVGSDRLGELEQPARQARHHGRTRRNRTRFDSGHFNIDTYAEDFTMLSSMQNVNPSTLQPYDGSANGESRWIGYGKVQTAAASEVWVRFFDTGARAKGVNPATNPIKAHDETAKNTIKLTVTINMYPDIPAQSKWMTVKAGDYRRDLFQVICAWSPWISETLGDTVGVRRSSRSRCRHRSRHATSASASGGRRRPRPTAPRSGRSSLRKAPRTRKR